MTAQRADGLVEFCLYRPGARQVSVVGDFNVWISANPMTRGVDGFWRCSLPLPSGSHQFLYHVDGAWIADYAAFGLERGPYGGWNSVVYVGPSLAA